MNDPKGPVYVEGDQIFPSLLYFALYCSVLGPSLESRIVKAREKIDVFSCWSNGDTQKMWLLQEETHTPNKNGNNSTPNNGGDSKHYNEPVYFPVDRTAISVVV